MLAELIVVCLAVCVMVMILLVRMMAEDVSVKITQKARNIVRKIATSSRLILHETFVCAKNVHNDAIILS